MCQPCRAEPSPRRTAHELEGGATSARLAGRRYTGAMKRPPTTRSATLLLTIWCALSACNGSGPPASGDAGLRCVDDLECDDGLFCNGEEVCAPGAAGADARGCARLLAPCAVDRCDEAANACAGECGDDADADADGFDAISCGGTDCDDMDARRAPGNAEVCDAEGVDEDCNPDTLGDDADGDGAVDGACCYDDGTTLRCGADCDDTNAAVGPGATEVCNGADEDCDGETDENLPVRFFGVDCDGDGFGDETRGLVLDCAAPQTAPDCADDGAWVTNATDCDDAVADISPAARESCDAVDEDCDTRVDEGLPLLTFAADCDGDGFADASATPTVSCALPSEGPSCGGVWSLVRTDCDDLEIGVRPTADEQCNGEDDDCDGRIDETLPVLDYRPDCDLDGFGDANASAIRDCVAPAEPTACDGGQWVGLGGDCDDGEGASRPGNAETCDGIDNDCDARIDEGPAGTSLQKACWVDDDRDGFAVLGSVAIGVCTADCPPGMTDVEPFDSDRADCDDTDTDVRELVLGLEDADGDGVGAAEVMGCPTASNFIVGTSHPIDCDDGDADVFPGQTEFFDAPRRYECNQPGYPVYCGDEFMNCGTTGSPPPIFSFPSCFMQENVRPATPIFDYDCDDSPTPPPASDHCAGCGACDGGYDYTNPAAECGQEVPFEICVNTCSLVGIKFCSLSETQTRVLPCR